MFFYNFNQNLNNSIIQSQKIWKNMSITCAQNWRTDVFWGFFCPKSKQFFQIVIPPKIQSQTKSKQFYNAAKYFLKKFQNCLKNHVPSRILRIYEFRYVILIYLLLNLFFPTLIFGSICVFHFAFKENWQNSLFFTAAYFPFLFFLAFICNVFFGVSCYRDFKTNNGWFYKFAKV